ncbi:MAG TPA: hypothetical protein VHN78_13910, partial [Chloroflexota bacterium]|nr:hypothetical protein [Chloroflexota bacterium]
MTHLTHLARRSPSGHLRRLAVALATATALAVAAWVPAPLPTPSPAAPASASPLFWTRSFYIANADRGAMRNLGCAHRDMAGRTSLFFGSPTVVQGTYGATLWGGANQTVAQVGELMQEFVRGYVACRRNPRNQLFVGMGTSNSAIDGKSDAWLLGHSVTWAETIKGLHAWANRYYPGVIRVYAAWDAEPSWSTPWKAEVWMRGYAATGGRRGLQANFSADGCPQRGAGNGGCNNGWNQHHLWNLAWRFDPSLPMPQIYARTGANARQWQQIDLYGARSHGDGMVFWGPMSQYT